jgi:hypothetical protein
MYELSRIEKYVTISHVAVYPNIVPQPTSRSNLSLGRVVARLREYARDSSNMALVSSHLHRGSFPLHILRTWSQSALCAAPLRGRGGLLLALGDLPEYSLRVPGMDLFVTKTLSELQRVSDNYLVGRKIVWNGERRPATVCEHSWISSG